MSIARARTALEAAKHLAAGGFQAEALSQAYYAAFYAARAALRALGVDAVRHSGVVTMFGQHLVRGEGFDPELGRVIRRLFEGRLEVTYRDVGISEERVTAAVADAEGFVSAVDAWLAERS